MDKSFSVYNRFDYDELISLNGLNCSLTGEHTQPLLLSMPHRIDGLFNCGSFLSKR